MKIEAGLPIILNRSVTIVTVVINKIAVILCE